MNKTTIDKRNLFTILASYLFYGWWDERFLGLIILSSITDYLLGIKVDKTTNKTHRKWYLYLSLGVNLGILGFFKYYNFFVESLIDVLDLFSISMSTSSLNIILPVGISFYTFQTMSYTIDIYRKQLKPTKNILSFFAFVSFFPQLVAGPIERASHLLQQFEEKKKFNYKSNIEGLRLALWGFFKKIVIADNFGLLADQFFNHPANVTMSGLAVIVATLCFALQIYADFSGYSDIAIGISRMLGFDLKSNFKTPYFATSFKDFWNRWHISLSTWFRDYVYIPLGGNRKKSSRVHFNIFITFFLSGLWHGSKVTFLIWGVLHGMMLVIEKILSRKWKRSIHYIIVRIMLILLWIPFRAENYTDMVAYFKQLFNFSIYSLRPINAQIEQFSKDRFYVLCLILILFLIVEKKIGYKDFNQWISQKKPVFRYLIYYGLAISIFLIGNFSVKPNFIYFQF